MVGMGVLLETGQWNITSYHYHIISCHIIWIYGIVSYHIISSYRLIDIEDQFEASTLSQIPTPGSSFFLCVFPYKRVLVSMIYNSWFCGIFGHGLGWNHWMSSNERIPNWENRQRSELTIGWWIPHLPSFPASHDPFSLFFFARPLWYGIDPYLWQLWMNSRGILPSCRDRPSKRMFQIQDVENLEGLLISDVTYSYMSWLTFLSNGFDMLLLNRPCLLWQELWRQFSWRLSSWFAIATWLWKDCQKGPWISVARWERAWWKESWMWLCSNMQYFDLGWDGTTISYWGFLK